MYSFFQIFTYLFTHVMVHSCLNLAAHYPYRSTITMPSSATRSPLDSSPCNGELRTQKLKSPSGENTELKSSPFKAWNRSVYSHTGYAYREGFLVSWCFEPSQPLKAWSKSEYSNICYAYCKGFLPFLSIHLHFFQNRSRFLMCWLWLTHGSCVGPQNKIGHLAGCRFTC